MAVIGTFGSYTAARLAIYSAQSAMHVTGNNIGNINTTGYTRQRTDQTSMYDTGTPRYQNSFNINIGYGAIVDQVSQLRDPFLDIRYRNENASLGYYEAMQNGLSQVSHILDEVGRGNEEFGIVEAQLGDFKNALRDLLEHPASTTHDDLVRGSASTLCTLLNSYAKELKQIKHSEEARLLETKDEINSILTDIRDLNEQIRTQSIYGGNALELRDKRNVQIDKLSKYMNIDVTYSMERINESTEVEKLTISLKNTKDYNYNRAGDLQKPITLVDGIYAVQLDFGPDENDSAAIMDANGNPTGKYYFYDIGTDWRDPKVKTWADKDATAANVAKYKELDFGTTLAINPEYNPITNPNAGKYLKEDGTTTDDMDKAAIIKTYQENAEDNQYVFRLTELKDKRDRIMYDGTPTKESYPVWLDDTDVYGALGAMRELLTEEGEFSSKLDVARDTNAAVKRGIPYYQHMLDSFTQQFAEQMNRANTLAVNDYAKAYELTGTLAYNDPPDNTIPADGTTFANKKSTTKPPEAIKATYPDPNNKGAEVTTDVTMKLLRDLKAIIDKAQDPAQDYPQLKADADGFMTDDTEIQEYQNALKAYHICLDTLRDNGTLTREYDHYDGGVLFSNNGEGDDPSNITAENIAISHSWAHGQNRVLNTLEGNTTYIDADTGLLKYHDGTTRDDNLAHIDSLLGQDMKYIAKNTVPDAVYNGTDFFEGNFQQMYGNITSTLGTDSRTTDTLYSNYNLTTLNLDNDRISVYGVDLNEEATNMMQYSQAFSAACKLLTTIDSMLDTLINRTI